MRFFKPFPLFLQSNSNDCGATCIRMIAKFYGKNYNLTTIKKNISSSKDGVSIYYLKKGLNNIGLKAIPIQIEYVNIADNINLPCIVRWNQSHYVVLYKIKGDKVYVADPAFGFIKYKKKEFLQGWETPQKNIGMIIPVEPMSNFNNLEDDKKENISYKYLAPYILKYRTFFLQLLLGFLLGSILQLIFPFLTQIMVDYGIHYHDVNFIFLVLLGQLVIFISKTLTEILRSWILLHIGNRINLSILSDFLHKLLSLPITFFESNVAGDILQRLNDQVKIESFLTSTVINMLFAFFNLFVFSIVLIIYDIKIFCIFLLGTIISTLWALYFQKARKELDYKKFNLFSLRYLNYFQLIGGIHDIKLNNIEKHKKNEWKKIQLSIFNLNNKNLSLQQSQQTGALFINEIKNLLMSFMAARAVIYNELTLGAMLSISYIIGQLNNPISNVSSFLNEIQDSQLSIERVNDIYQIEDEVIENNEGINISTLEDIEITNLSFSYNNNSELTVLKDISCVLPKGKVTAIVGSSGSGKTTLVKLLLKFYSVQKNRIFVGDSDISNINTVQWRNLCSAVLQDGFIFSDSITMNIVMNPHNIDTNKLQEICKICNCHEFIISIPGAYDAKIGEEGVALSQGQKQRILIARALYKNPDYLFLDEATSSLDAINEREIQEKIDRKLKGKTVVIVAHRLSTVKSADQIIVLNKGKITEIGIHEELVIKKGDYYNLVKNQLELG